MTFHISRRLALDIDAADRAVRAALQTEGFGVLSEIDVAATLKAKLGVERPAYRILGACNPELARRALEAEPRIGVMLPCNVALRALPEGGVEVMAIDPQAAMAATGVAALAPLAEEVRARLARALDKTVAAEG